MATKAKKQQRQQRRHADRRRSAELPKEIFITADAGECEIQFLEAAASDGAAADAPKLKTFKMRAYTGGRLFVNQFYYPVVVDLAGLKVPKQTRPILRQHDSNRIVGHSTLINATNKTIDVEGVISGVGKDAEEVVATNGNGFPWESSIGCKLGKVAFVDEGEKVQVNGKTFTGPLYVARQSILGEVSFVALGGDEGGATARISASQKDLEMNEFEQWLEAQGFVSAELTAKQRASLEAAYSASVDPGDEDDEDDDPAGDVEKKKKRRKLTAAAADGNAEADDDFDPMAEIRAQHVDELKRTKAIHDICAKFGQPKFKVNGKEVDLEIHAIEQNLTAETTELYAMRESRAKAPAGHSHSHEGTCTLQAMQGALMLRAGMALDSEIWRGPRGPYFQVPKWLRAGLNDDLRQQVMEAAHRFSDMSMVDIAREAVRIDGKHIPSGRKDVLEAAFSGSALTNIFSTNVNTVILATYGEATDTTLGWCSEREVADFKTNDRTRMTKGPNLQLLPRGGEADHASRSDLKESYKIGRYAKQWVVDEQDFIDDSFDALSDMPREFALAAARLRPDLVYAILLANAALNADSVALFHSTHSNLNTSAALASDKIKACIAAMEKQRENNVNLNIRATHLIVPSDLKHSANEFVSSSSIIIAGTAGAVTERGTTNTIAAIESLQVVADSRLSNGVIDPASGEAQTSYSGSTSTWFMAGAGAHTIEVGYLRGTGRAPQVRSFQLDRGKWGMGWDINMDIGAKALDYRGLQKNTA